MSDLSIRLFELTSRAAQEGESVTSSFDRESLPKQLGLFSKYATVGIRLCNAMCVGVEECYRARQRSKENSSPLVIMM